MKKIGAILFYLLVGIALVIFFSPKRQLYYLAEHVANPYGVVLSGEYVDDNGFALSLEGGTLYYQDLKIAQLGDVTVLPLLFFNALSVGSFSVSDEMQRFVPGTIDGVRIIYSVIDPTRIHLEGSGEFGSLAGVANLLEHKVRITLKPSAALLQSKPVWLKELKAQPSGEYLYEVAY